MSDEERSYDRARAHAATSQQQYPPNPTAMHGAWPPQGATEPMEYSQPKPQPFEQQGMGTPMRTPFMSAAGTSGSYATEPAGGRGLGGASSSRDTGGSLGRGSGSYRDHRIPSSELLKTRPTSLQSKTGSDGKAIRLQANYFKMLTTTDWCLYKYRVDFNPEEDRNVVRKGMLKLHRPTIGAYIFDGTVLYTSNRLPQPLELCSLRKSDEKKIVITIRLVDDMAKGDENYLQFFNIIMRKCLEYLHLQLVGRNFFDARNKVEVREYKLELWPGYDTSIRQHERDILMRAEITHKVMRQQTLFDILNECYNRYGESYQARFSSQVIGLTVLTDYNNNTYRVDDVDYSVSPLSTFSCKGQDITYKKYYLDKYQINIRDSKQPLLLSKSKSRDRRAGLAELVYLVPELCRSTGLTDEMRSDNQMMRQLANHTRLNPNARIQRLMSFNSRLQSEPKVVEELKEWNLKLDTRLVDIPARVFDTEKIVFGRNASASAGQQADWTREIRNKQMIVTAKLQKWFVIVPNRLVRDTQTFVGAIRSSVREMQFPIGDPENYVLNDDRAHSYTSAIEDIMSRENPQLIMCVVPNNRADRYSAIKKKCCIDRPVPSQCILAKNLNGKGLGSIATKVAVQVNCKIGGAPWAVIVPLKGLMVVGFDVCHDTNTKGRDFGALVASLDPTFSRYYSAISAHTSGEELSNDLGVNMCKALRKYQEVNKALPSRIVIYRDGVSEGQISYVFEHEVENLKSKLASVYGDPELVKMAFIIVTKRLNTRLFFNGNNPPPGTVVDDVITNPLRYDFFVVSQFIKQGSVSPTAYSVISDNVKLDASKLQRLTYKLTHMYFNWSGTVRVPAPCQFAHKLAFLVSQSLHASPSAHLDTLLYFFIQTSSELDRFRSLHA